jgi:pilus assembly protein FimV
MADLGLDNLKFEAPMFPEETTAAATESAARGEPALDEDTLALDFDFNLDHEASAETQPKQPSNAETMMPELDLSGINLNLDEASNTLTPMEDVAAAGHALEDATTLVGDSTVWEEASTKLDLARAYLEMGDKEGAREILQEVVAEGGPDQQSEANKLLSTLS